MERPIPLPIPTCPHMISHICTLADLQVCPNVNDEVTTSMPILQPGEGITSAPVDQYTRKAKWKTDSPKYTLQLLLSPYQYTLPEYGTRHPQVLYSPLRQHHFLPTSFPESLSAYRKEMV